MVRTKKKPKWPQIYAHAETQAHYEQCRANGCTDAMAQMLAERQAPGSKGTDRAFMEGRNNGGYLDDMPDFLRQKFLQKAKRAGVSLAGKTYVSGLATEACDPHAWVSGVDELMSRVKAQNAHLTGIREHVAVDVPPPPSTPLAEDLVQESVRNLVKSNPGLKAKSKKELREMAIDKHALPRKTTAKK